VLLTPGGEPLAATSNEHAQHAVQDEAADAAAGRTVAGDLGSGMVGVDDGVGPGSTSSPTTTANHASSAPTALCPPPSSTSRRSAATAWN
jgi:hypothetical protein